MGAVASTIGKIYIAVHRYFTLRSQQLTENVILALYSDTNSQLLLMQFAISILLFVHVWPAGFKYVFVGGVSIVGALDDATVLISKTIHISSYCIFIICNATFTFLSCRELMRVKRMVEENVDTARAIIRTQRNMILVVTACSISHFVKAAQQYDLFMVGVTLHAIQYPIKILQYPIANGLATYVSPVALVIFSATVRRRL
ncbi:hypothetical protein PFISCL1PPCAC_18459, partial [Pristionchus fissidentatus]